MVEINRKRVYSEVYGILESMGDTYKDAIPKKLYKFIKENRDTNYSPTYDMKLPLSNQNLSPRTTAFICMLHYNYWCKTEDEKVKINKILEYNEKKNREKYNPENIFKQNKKVESKNREEQIQLIEYKENIFKKIFNKLKELFKFAKTNKN